MNLVEQVTEQVRTEIEQGILKAKADGRFDFAEMPAFIVEVPKDKSHGDFATNAAMLLTKQAKMKPRDIAQAIVDSLNKESKLIEKVEIAGPGFINFYLSQNWLYDILPVVEAQDTAYGSVDIGKGEKVQVEFVSANPTGLLHMGNARGGALGDSLANLLKMAGYDVTKEFYINDAGNQIVNLGLSLEARYRQLLGETGCEIPENGYHGQDIIDTAQRIVDAVGDSYLQLPEAERQEKMIATALDEKIAAIKSGLAAFGVEYDVWFSETTLHESGAVKEVVDLLTEKGMTYEKDGAIWLKTTDFGEEKDEVLIRSNGIPTYFAADIAYHKNKFDRGFKRVINIWGADHHGHVARMKRSMDAIGYNGDDLTVLLMQLVRLYQNGEVVRMSKRTGQYVTLQELIEDVGKDAARYFFIMRNPDSHLDFDLDLAVRQDSENPVYYVQYAHARICTLLKNLAAEGYAVKAAADVDLSLLSSETEIALIKELARYGEAVRLAAQNYDPSHINRYLVELSAAFHRFYNACRIKGEEENVLYARLKLADTTRAVLHNAMTLIGCTAPEKM